MAVFADLIGGWLTVLKAAPWGDSAGLALSRPGRSAVLALAILLGGCFGGKNDKCQQARQRIAEGATCFVAKNATATPNTPTRDSDSCEFIEREYHSFGLTSHDAGKIVATSVDQFFKTYRGTTFCAFYEKRLAG
jgi:hypothetical protein